MVAAIGSNKAPAHLSGLDLIYNPSFGSYLIWRAASGHFSESGRGLPIALAFLVLPIALHGESKSALIGTNMPSGLTLFAAKLGAKQESLLAIHERAIALRSLSLASLTTGTMAKFMIVDPGTATILSLDSEIPSPSSSMRKLGLACEKLGVWFGRLPVDQVASILRVAF
ncbi:three component ABC system middle component [Stenotrophomonas pavanii]|uniref:three component ABC system middle component n=1 Tax=Stenotrophomonas pavanii TaxID=487698 RepID=UPI003CCE6433